MPRRVCVGVVTSDKSAKTRVVEIPRLVKHPVYGRYLRRKTVCYVHDETEQSSLGDKVEIVESRPRSRTKRWELVKIVERGRDQAVSGLPKDTLQNDSMATSDGIPEGAPEAIADSAAGLASETNQDSQP